MKMKLYAELIFIWKVSHLDSFWNWGKGELGNSLLDEWKAFVDTVRIRSSADMKIKFLFLTFAAFLDVGIGRRLPYVA